MSLSSHFKKAPSPVDPSSPSWLSAASFTPIGLTDNKREETKVPTEPKDSLPSKVASTNIKNIRFNAYKSTRPALLQEITNCVDNGMNKLKQIHGDEIPHDQELALYSETFEKYIEESTLYKPFLQAVKKKYDDTIAFHSKKLEYYDTFDNILQENEEKYQTKLNESILESKELINKLELKLQETILLNKTSLNKIDELNLVNKKINEENISIKKECEGLKTTCSLLASQLTRLAEEKIKNDTTESLHLLELSKLKENEISFNNEIDRYYYSIAYINNISISYTHT